MNEETVRQIIQQEMNNYRTSFTSPSVTPHIHNGADSPKIMASNLVPYDFIDDLQTSGGVTIPGYEGQIYYNKNIGVVYFYLNNQWNVLDINASGLQAYLSANQTIPDATPTTIIFDTVLYDPQSQYNSTTGVFQTNGFYLITARATFESGLSGNPIELTIWSEDNNIPLATSYTIDNGDTVSAQVSYMANMSTAISVRVTQSSGGSKDLLSGLENTSLYIKKFISV